jgi:hypothetical protein
MCTIISLVKTRQEHFRPRMLMALMLISIISGRFMGINTAQLNSGLKRISQHHTMIALSQIGNSAPTDHMALAQQPDNQPTPDTATTPTTTSENGTSPSGQAVPIGDIPGWHQIFAEDFHTNVPVGGFPGSAYGSKFIVYSDGTQDTAGFQGAPSRYYPSKVASVSNGSLNLYLHTENGTPMGAAVLPIIPGNHLYGKYTIRFRSDTLPGFRTAWLLWPSNGNWPYDGELDFPESGLDEPIHAFMHHSNATSGSDQDIYNTTASYTSWHTASIEWSPNKANFIFDDKSIGTSTTRVPNTPMQWILQTEACLPTCPAASTAGNLQIAWIAAYSPT